MLHILNFIFRTACARTDKILTLQSMGANEAGTSAKWLESPLTLKQPKSSHTLLIVPKTYAPKCKL